MGEFQLDTVLPPSRRIREDAFAAFFLNSKPMDTFVVDDGSAQEAHYYAFEARIRVLVWKETFYELPDGTEDSRWEPVALFSSVDTYQEWKFDTRLASKKITQPDYPYLGDTVVRNHPIPTRLLGPGDEG